MENAARRFIDHTRAQRNVGNARGEDTFRGQYSPMVSKWPGPSVQSLQCFLLTTDLSIKKLSLIFCKNKSVGVSNSKRCLTFL